LEETSIHAGGLEAHGPELPGDVVCCAAGALASDFAALKAVIRKIPDVRHRPTVHIRGGAGSWTDILRGGRSGKSGLGKRQQNGRKRGFDAFERHLCHLGRKLS